MGGLELSEECSHVWGRGKQGGAEVGVEPAIEVWSSVSPAAALELEEQQRRDRAPARCWELNKLHTNRPTGRKYKIPRETGRV